MPITLLQFYMAQCITVSGFFVFVFFLVMSSRLSLVQVLFVFEFVSVFVFVFVFFLVLSGSPAFLLCSSACHWFFFVFSLVWSCPPGCLLYSLQFFCFFVISANKDQFVLWSNFVMFAIGFLSCRAFFLHLNRFFFMLINCFWKSHNDFKMMMRSFNLI